MKFDISKTIKGGKIFHIARDISGTVRFREKTLEELQEAIKNYQPPKKQQEEGEVKNKNEGILLGKAQDESVKKKEVQTEDNSPTLTETDKEDAVEEKKEFLKSETKEIIETKRKSSGKKTFWDKLK